MLSELLLHRRGVPSQLKMIIQNCTLLCKPIENLYLPSSIQNALFMTRLILRRQVARVSAHQGEVRVRDLKVLRALYNKGTSLRLIGLSHVH